MAIPIKYRFESRGEMMNIRQLVELHHPTLTGPQVSNICTRFRSWLKTHSFDKSMELMIAAKPPVARSESTQAALPEWDMANDFDKWDDDLELTRSTYNHIRLGVSEENIAVRSRYI